jgi:acyl-CoA synthetase (AMP-forming)/AMP-acid ligase II
VSDSSIQDVISAVEQHSLEMPAETCVRTFSRRTPEQARTWQEIVTGMKRAAAWFQRQSIRPGDIVALIGTHHIDFYATWLGCVWCGGVPTVLAEPSVRIAKEIYWSRLNQLFARIGLWGAVLDPRLKIDDRLMETIRVGRYDEIAADQGVVSDRHRPQPERTLLLQHSSGTTGLHKGVMLSHEAVWRHVKAYNEAIKLSRNDSIATWLPLYHDMGFIACFVDALLLGVPVIWLSPFEWVANPGLLLEAISQHKATVAWLPNFAFSFLAQRVKEGSDQFDLSTLRALVNCSEPVSAASMQAFSDRFVTRGFAPSALQTCYAMAENVFAVSTSSDADPPRLRWVDRKAWHDEHIAVAAAAESTSAVQHLSNGKCVAHCEVRIVDANGRTLPANHAGRVMVRSPFLFSGYFAQPELSATAFDADGFFDTGDLGYVDELGHVYVTGRSKDLIIVGGKNIYPQDVEQVVAEVDGVYPGRIVCFGVQLPSLGTEGLVVLVESEEPCEKWPDIIHHLRRAVPSRLDLDPTDVRIVERNTLRKSTSGKLARGGNREWYLEGRFGPIPSEISSEE